MAYEINGKILRTNADGASEVYISVTGDYSFEIYDWIRLGKEPREDMVLRAEQHIARMNEQKSQEEKSAIVDSVEKDVDVKPAEVETIKDVLEQAGKFVTISDEALIETPANGK